TVGATDQNDNIATFSTHSSPTSNPGVLVAAPGVNIISTWLNNSYAYDSGTSMAAPYASGLAALIWGSTCGTGVSDVYLRIMNNADNTADNMIHHYWVYGRINFERSLTGCTSIPNPLPSPRP